MVGLASLTLKVSNLERREKMRKFYRRHGYRSCPYGCCHDYSPRKRKVQVKRKVRRNRKQALRQEV